jgi:hypothetical protein
MQMGKIAGMEVVAEDAEDPRQRIECLKGELSAAMNDEVDISSPLMRLPAAQQKMYEHFFELIYQCSVNRVAAKALIDRILLRLEQAESPKARP